VYVETSFDKGTQILHGLFVTIGGAEAVRRFSHPHYFDTPFFSSFSEEGVLLAAAFDQCNFSLASAGEPTRTTGGTSGRQRTDKIVPQLPLLSSAVRERWP